MKAGEKDLNAASGQAGVGGGDDFYKSKACQKIKYDDLVSECIHK